MLPSSFLLGDVDLNAGAGALGVVQTAEQGESCCYAGDGVGKVDVGDAGALMLVALPLPEAAHCLDDRAESDCVGVGTVDAECGHAHQHDAGVHRGQRGEVQPELGQHMSRKVGDQGVAAAHEFQEGGLAFGRCQGDDTVALALVDGVEVTACLVEAVVMDQVLEARRHAMVVRPLRPEAVEGVLRLDLDDVDIERGQQVADVGTSPSDGHLDDSQLASATKRRLGV